MRRKHGAYLIEGVRLTHEAVASGQRASVVLYDPEALARTTDGARLLESLGNWADRAYEATPRVVAAVAQTESPSGVVAALVRSQTPPLTTGPLGIVLDGLSDPGNAGTILRTADAVGASYVIGMPAGVDLFAPKVLRAGMGAHFRLPLYTQVTWDDLLDHVAADDLVAMDAGATCSIYDFPWREPVCLLVGNEAHGLSAEARVRVTSLVRIPMRSAVQSLNASVAASITMYHVHGRNIPVGA